MSLDEQLNELLTRLHVRLEEPGERAATANTTANTEDDEADEAIEAYEAYRTHEDEVSRRRVRRTQTGQAGQASEHRGERMEQRDEWNDQDTPDHQMNEDEQGTAEISLFQTSREHYGVFYRLDLVGGAPCLRIFTPDEANTLRMRCYLVRPALGTPVREWFLATRAHDGSDAYEACRETVEQHLLFAAGEALKRLFWTGELERMRFPTEIEVARVA
ncbi:MAG: hypothetical protein ABI068_11065 [Ktedonobacterales bacterium]